MTPNLVTRRSLVLMLGTAAVGACGSVGMMASNTKSFQATDRIRLRRAPRNFVADVQQIGPRLGYAVSGIDAVNNSVSFNKDAGMFIGVMVGKIENSTIVLTQNGRTIDIQLTIIGNFGTSDQVAATQELEAFKREIENTFS